MGDTNHWLYAENETERGEIESGAPSEEFVVAEGSELEFSGAAPPSNIWSYEQPESVNPRVCPMVHQWQRASDAENERYTPLQYPMSQPSTPLLGSGSGYREEDMEILSEGGPTSEPFRNCFTERSPTIISGSTKKNLTKSLLSHSMASLSLENRALIVYKWLKRICTPLDFIDKRVNFLKATVAAGFVVLLVVLFYSFWPRRHNGYPMLRDEGNITRDIEGNVMNFYWEGDELKTYIQDKNQSTYSMKRYDYELLEIPPVESYLLRSVMRDFQCEETKWVENFVCCYDPRYGTVCARRLENNDWMVLPKHSYHAEFLTKNGQNYLVAQERLNTMPYLMDSMGAEIPIETHECGDAFQVLQFDITNEKIAIVFQKQLNSDKNSVSQSLLLIDPFDENDHKCFQREELPLGRLDKIWYRDELQGIWVERDVVWILFCEMRKPCSVHLLALEGLKPMYYYSFPPHGPFTENSATKKHNPRFVGKTENNNLNIYTFVNGNDSAKIIRKRISIPDKNAKS